MKIKVKKNLKAKKNTKYPKPRPFRLYDIGGKIYYKKGGKMFAYGGNIGDDDEYGSYKKSDGTEEGKAYTSQVTSGVSTGVQAGSSFGPIGMAIGAVGGLIGGAVGGGAELKKIAARNAAAQEREHDRREGIAKSVLGNYPTKGVAGTHAMYRHGGKLRYANGGTIGDPPDINGYLVPDKKNNEQSNRQRNAMMKRAIARNTAVPFVNRMTQQDPASLYLGKDEKGYDITGTHQLGSYGKYVLPRIVREGSSLRQLPEGKGVYDYHKKQGFKNAMTFDNDQDAIDFAEHYKDVAPMYDKHREYAKGGKLDGPGDPPKNILEVKSKTDPRYLAYQDSSNMYNAYKMQQQVHGKGSPLSGNPGLWNTKALDRRRTKSSTKEPATSKEFFKTASPTAKKLVEYYKSLGFDDKNIGYRNSPEVYSNTIKPTGSYKNKVDFYNPVYPKPHTQVVVNPNKKKRENISSYLKKRGIPNDFAARKAAYRGEDEYTGSIKQNTKYLEDYKAGVYDKPATPIDEIYTDVQGLGTGIVDRKGKDKLSYGELNYAVGGQMQGPGAQQGVNPQQFQPVASDVNQVQGPSHEQGGVQAGGGNEVEGGEVTSPQGDGSTNVFSDRIEVTEGLTFADAAAEIGKKKGKYEERLESNSIFVKGTARREVEKLDGELQRLFMAQEEKKRAMGIPDPNQQAAEQQAMQQQQGAEQQMQQQVQEQAQPEMQGQSQFAMGGKYAYGSYMNYGSGPGGKGKLDIRGSKEHGFVDQWGKRYNTDDISKMENSNTTVYLDDSTKPPPPGPKARKGTGTGKGKAALGVIQGVLPYVDNITNAILTANTPDVPKPKPYRSVPLKTDYNINPQLAAINASEAATAGALHQNTKGSGSYRTNLISSRMGSVGQRNQLYGEKYNRETALINANRQNQQQIGMANVDKESQYDMLNLQRQGEIQSRISQNVAQATDDAQLQIREKNLMKRDQLEMSILAKQYKDSGVWDRNLQKLIDDYNAGTIEYTAFRAGLQVYDTQIANKKNNPNN